MILRVRLLATSIGAALLAASLGGIVHAAPACGSLAEGDYSDVFTDQANTDSDRGAIRPQCDCSRKRRTISRRAHRLTLQKWKAGSTAIQRAYSIRHQGLGILTPPEKPTKLD